MVKAIFQCLNVTIKPKNCRKISKKYPCKLTNDDEDEYSLALLPEGTVVPDLGGMTLI